MSELSNSNNFDRRVKFVLPEGWIKVSHGTGLDCWANPPSAELPSQDLLTDSTITVGNNLAGGLVCLKPGRSADAKLYSGHWDKPVVMEILVPTGIRELPEDLLKKLNDYFSAHPFAPEYAFVPKDTRLILVGETPDSSSISKSTPLKLTYVPEEFFEFYIRDLQKELAKQRKKKVALEDAAVLDILNITDDEETESLDVSDISEDGEISDAEEPDIIIIEEEFSDEASDKKTQNKKNTGKIDEYNRQRTLREIEEQRAALNAEQLKQDSIVPEYGVPAFSDAPNYNNEPYPSSEDVAYPDNEGYSASQSYEPQRDANSGQPLPYEAENQPGVEDSLNLSNFTENKENTVNGFSDVNEGREIFDRQFDNSVGFETESNGVNYGNIEYPSADSVAPVSAPSYDSDSQSYNQSEGVMTDSERRRREYIDIDNEARIAEEKARNEAFLEKLNQDALEKQRSYEDYKSFEHQGVDFSGNNQHSAYGADNVADGGYEQNQVDTPSEMKAESKAYERQYTGNSPLSGQDSAGYEAEKNILNFTENKEKADHGFSDVVEERKIFESPVRDSSVISTAALQKLESEYREAQAEFRSYKNDADVQSIGLRYQNASEAYFNTLREIDAGNISVVEHVAVPSQQRYDRQEGYEEKSSPSVKTGYSDGFVDHKGQVISGSEKQRRERIDNDFDSVASESPEKNRYSDGHFSDKDYKSPKNYNPVNPYQENFPGDLPQNSNHHRVFASSPQESGYLKDVVALHYVNSKGAEAQLNRSGVQGADGFVDHKGQVISGSEKQRRERIDEDVLRDSKSGESVNHSKNPSTVSADNPSQRQPEQPTRPVENKAKASDSASDIGKTTVAGVMGSKASESSKPKPHSEQPSDGFVDHKGQVISGSEKLRRDRVDNEIVNSQKSVHTSHSNQNVQKTHSESSSNQINSTGKGNRSENKPVVPVVSAVGTAATVNADKAQAVYERTKSDFQASRNKYNTHFAKGSQSPKPLGSTATNAPEPTSNRGRAAVAPPPNRPGSKNPFAGATLKYAHQLGYMRTINNFNRRTTNIITMAAVSMAARGDDSNTVSTARNGLQYARDAASAVGVVRGIAGGVGAVIIGNPATMRSVNKAYNQVFTASEITKLQKKFGDDVHFSSKQLSGKISSLTNQNRSLKQQIKALEKRGALTEVERNSLRKKFGNDVDLTKGQLSGKLHSLEEHNRSVKRKIKALEAKGSSLTAAERNKLMKLKKEKATNDIQLRKMHGLQNEHSKSLRTKLSAEEQKNLSKLIGLKNNNDVRLRKLHGLQDERLKATHRYSKAYRLNPDEVKKTIKKNKKREKRGVVYSKNELKKLEKLQELKGLNDKRRKLNKAKASRQQLSASLLGIIGRAAQKSEESAVQSVVKATRFVQNRYVRAILKVQIKVALWPAKKAARLLRRGASALNKKLGVTAAIKKKTAETTGKILSKKPIAKINHKRIKVTNSTNALKKKVVNKKKSISKARVKALEKLKNTKVGKFVSSVSKGFGKVGNAFRFVKGFLLKLGFSAVVILLIISLVGAGITAVGGAVSSFFLTDVEDDDGRLDLSEFVDVINDCQKDFQKDISGIATGKNVYGKGYDNVFYDYNGMSGNNTAQILSMAYVRFGCDVTGSRKSYVKDYIEQLYKDSNYVDYAESDPYFCDNGCVERSYKCYDDAEEHETETRKSLRAASDHYGESGVSKTNEDRYGCKYKTYRCTERGHGVYNRQGCTYHNNGKAMSKPCSCAGCKKKTSTVTNSDGTKEEVVKYYCQGYCPGKHKDYSCSGHKEKVCYGEHQDVTITITCLDFDDIFAADSSVALTGSSIKGEAYDDKFVITGYCSCAICCGPNSTGKTASGTTPKANHTIATDWSVIPKGTHVWIDGKEYVAEDKGGAIKGNRIDIYFNSHSEALQWGRRTKTVYKSEVISDPDKDVIRQSPDYKVLAEEVVSNSFVVQEVLKCFGEAKEPVVSWAMNINSTDEYVEELKRYDVKHENEEFTNVELNTFEYVKMSLDELQKLAKKRDKDSDYTTAFNIITKVLIPYDKEHPDVLINKSTDEEDLYFAGWNEDNIKLAKNVYDGFIADDADDIYAGLEGITNLSYGSAEDVEVDFSGIVFDDSSGLTRNQQKVLAVIKANNLATTAGRCQAWVADVYVTALGGQRFSKCCANHAGAAWGVSNDWSKIQVGATVYGYSSSIYGHVGIYIGNGQVAHNIGYCKVQSLESWVKTYNGQCWGWNGGKNLTGNSKYNCKPAKTFMVGKD